MTDQKKAAAPARPPAPAAGAAADGISRRQLLRSGMFGTVGLFMTQALVGAGVMFWPAKVSGFGGKVVVPKKLDEIKPGDPPIKVREGKFWLSRLETGNVMALYWKCPHLGCTVPWAQDENLFHCPCHGSLYNRTGQNVGGPAPRPMDYMEVEIQKDGTIIVNTGKITQRAKHEAEHETKV